MKRQMRVIKRVNNPFINLFTEISSVLKGCTVMTGYTIKNTNFQSDITNSGMIKSGMIMPGMNIGYDYIRHDNSSNHKNRTKYSHLQFKCSIKNKPK